MKEGAIMIILGSAMALAFLLMVFVYGEDVIDRL